MKLFHLVVWQHEKFQNPCYKENTKMSLDASLQTGL
jgi:hypothetical protein